MLNCCFWIDLSVFRNSRNENHDILQLKILYSMFFIKSQNNLKIVFLVIVSFNMLGINFIFIASKVLQYLFQKTMDFLVVQTFYLVFLLCQIKTFKVKKSFYITLVKFQVIASALTPRIVEGSFPLTNSNNGAE
jgi:hypothetical protein